MCWSHALVNGPTSKRPASDGGLCSGQLLVMWSAVCSGSPHSHAALSASPHFFMDALYRPTPVRNLFKVVQCFRHRSSPLTSSAGFDTWRCTRVDRMLPTPASTLPQSMHPSTGPQGWHLLSLLVVGFTGLESAWGHFVLCRVVQDVPVVFHCFPCQGEGGCFPPLAGRGYPC